MNAKGPQIDRLTHRLAECPPDFLEVPRHGNTGVIDVGAIVCDHLREMGAKNPSAMAAPIHRYGAKRQQLISIISWMLHDDWFLARPELAETMQKLFVSDQLGELSQLIRPPLTITDPDRREELARICLRELGLHPEGESEAEAKDRLTTLDSVERERVVRKTRAAEARAREIRKKMAEKAAQEAAARYSRE